MYKVMIRKNTENKIIVNSEHEILRKIRVVLCIETYITLKHEDQQK